MSAEEKIGAAARMMWSARQRRETYRNLPDDVRPQSLADAYAGQEAYAALAASVYGPVAGAKIATTTKVMQELMGIDHACGGLIFAKTIHQSPATLRQAEFINLRIECEIALELPAHPPAAGAPRSAGTGRPRGARAMPALAPA